MSASEQDTQGPVIRDRRRIDPVTGQPRQPAGSDQAGQAQTGDPAAGQTPRGSGQPRPGKHGVSKPGIPRTENAGPDPAAPEDGADKSAPDQAAADQPEPESDTAPSGETSKGTTGGADVAAMLAERTADLQRLQAEYANYRKRVERDRVAVREQALASVLTELLPVLDDIGRAREHDELTGGFKAVADALQAAATKLGLTPFGEAGEPFDPNVHEALMHSYSADVTEPTCVQILQPGYKVGERILRPARVSVAEPTDPAGARPASEAEADDAGQVKDDGQADESGQEN
jgi:molecular chaperone GrpE